MDPFHYMRLRYKIPATTSSFEATAGIKFFIYDHLEEFKCLPKDESINDFIKTTYKQEEECKLLYIMVRLTDEEAVKTACDRSEFKHSSEKLKKSEKDALKKKRKRGDSESSGDRKRKTQSCSICLNAIRKETVLDCGCAFHYTCIKKWMECKKKCPTCLKPVKL